MVRWLGLEKLSGYNPHVKQFEAPRPVAIACFYIAVFLYFEMAWDYCSEMLAPAFGTCSVERLEEGGRVRIDSRRRGLQKKGWNRVG